MSKLNPEKLSVDFREGVTTTEPIIPRRYTLTHSDITAELFLTIGLKYAYDKISAMRDEVLGEWIKTRNGYFFHVYLHVDGQLGPTVTAIRNAVFRRELPLALEAIRYGDKKFFSVHPNLNNSQIIVYFNSINPYFNSIENWGTFSDYDITSRAYPYPYRSDTPIYNSDFSDQYIPLKDYGPEPFVVNITEATKQNNNYRTALWTGNHLQLTLMSINVGEDIGLEVHQNLDQFIRIEEGEGLVKMGDSKYNLDFQRKVYDDFAFIIPAGKWHNLINTGDKPIKLYSIYAPPQHPHGTVHETKSTAQVAEKDHV